MSSIVVSGDTSGAITISAPAVAGTNTITLPAATGTMMVSGNMPAFSVYMSANQSVTTGTWTKAQLNTENFDTNSYFDNATNYRFTPLVAGYYQINGSTNTESSTTRTRLLAAIYKNGTEYKRADMNYTNVNSSFVADVVYFNGSTDYVELYGFVNGTGTVFVGGNYATFFSGAMVRSA